MTGPDSKGSSNPPPRGSVVAGAQSAGSTTLLRHCLAALTVDELLRTDRVVQLVLHGNPGARS